MYLRNTNEYNENNINDDFQPKKINESDLTSGILHKIKSTASESKEEYDSYNVTFYGKYNGAYAIKLNSTLFNIPAVETSYYIDGIYFSFPTIEILIFILGTLIGAFGHYFFVKPKLKTFQSLDSEVIEKNK